MCVTMLCMILLGQLQFQHVYFVNSTCGGGAVDKCGTRNCSIFLRQQLSLPYFTLLYFNGHTPVCSPFKFFCCYSTFSLIKQKL